MMEPTVRKQYNRMAALYDRVWSRYLAKTLSFLNEWAPIAPTSTVLDVACGTGEFEHLLLSKQPAQHIIGIDLAEKMLAIAQQKCRDYPNVFFQKASVSALPFADRRFDVVVSASAFHYFDDPIEALIEMKRVLKPDGDLIILDWCKDDLLCRLYDFVLKQFDPAYRQCYTQAKLHTFLHSTGFTIQRASRTRVSLAWAVMVVIAKPTATKPVQSET